MNTEAETQNIRFAWQWNWKILLFALLFLPITIRLGFWQLSRAEEKQALLETHQQRKASPVVAFDQLPDAADHQYLRVAAQGQYDNRSTLLLDNRVRRGRPGYEVVSIFRTAGGRTVLVNRGWVAAALDRTILPEVSRVQGPVTLSGYLYRSPGKQVMLAEEHWQADRALQIVQNAAPDVASEQLGERFYGYQLRLDKSAPGALQTGWHLVNVQPGKHTGYAVQWFAIAALLVLLSVLANSNLATVWRSRRRGGGRDE